jgi:molybdopterin synthase sulfur carrier subunit
MALTKQQTVKITVRYFAQARELAGLREESIELPSTFHVQEAVSRIMETHPRLREMQQITRVVINGRMTDENVVLNDGDVVVLVPPIAGG